MDPVGTLRAMVAAVLIGEMGTAGDCGLDFNRWREMGGYPPIMPGSSVHIERICFSFAAKGPAPTNPERVRFYIGDPNEKMELDLVVFSRIWRAVDPFS